MAKNKEIAEEVVASQIQEYISEGRQVLIKKEGEKTHVSIRYNNMDTDGSKKWRLLLNGNEFLASEIFINIPTRTESIEIEGVGIKHHIGCLANQIEFKETKAHIN